MQPYSLFFMAYYVIYVSWDCQLTSFPSFSFPSLLFSPFCSFRKKIIFSWFFIQGSVPVLVFQNQSTICWCQLTCTTVYITFSFLCGILLKTSYLHIDVVVNLISLLILCETYKSVYICPHPSHQQPFTVLWFILIWCEWGYD